MRLEEHYLKLYRGLHPRGLEGGTEATLAELAGLLHCTERNVKLLLRGMQTRDWIRWEPGRGRGNRSRLELRAEPDRLLLEQVKERLAQGRLREAVALAEQGTDTPDGRRQLEELLQEEFGYRREPSPDEKQGPMEVLRFPAYRQLGSLDPAYATRRTELHMIRQLFDTLVRYDRETDRFLPGLAHHWERVADEGGPERWIFALQKHVRFHNGKPLTARDTAYTLERLRGAGQPHANSPYGPLYEGLEAVAALDDFHLEIRLREPLGPLLGLLASPAASIVPAGLTADFAFRPVGTGPFRLAERESRFFALEAFADYYKRRAHLDRVEMWCLPSTYDGNEDSEAEDEAELGGLNFRHFRHFRPYRESGESRLQEHWLEETNIDRGCKFIALNWRSGSSSPWSDAGLRELLAFVLRNGSVQLDLDGNRGPLANRFIRDMEGDDNATPPAPDCKAGHSPAIACHAGGTPADRLGERTLRLVTYAGAGHERDAAWLQRALAPYGVRLELAFVPYEALFEEETLAVADLYSLEQPVQEDAEWTLLALLANANSPVRRCLPPELREMASRLCAKLPGEPSRARRLALLGRLEETILRERAVILWYRWQQSASYPPGLRDVSISSLGWVDYRKLWFDGRR
ncbi:ABC transporter substrate-binding protein [Paenibacillus oleatilyticus]|uniref:ABC transporter substrate-binding protein n=1 Tax=Paenibacillus oleatilyticus TaxID=2594886 RepID=UPI001C1FDBAA|nr:ABC transporter substrate-binding protein [Paenibacillus oleatilyticus]MBU7315749.1 SgrR family transcriptional regulator [Paenibacillus oleatilyticus]